jgi:alkanesulfonate monooxygenase SsuD/methylene tetrahydromethanopterin reductase-like flavin-dependent oxidoreductase (luciferase family)
LKRKYEVLERHCQEVGRDFNAITRTTTTLVIMQDTDEAARGLVPPGLDFAWPGDLGAYGLVGTPETVAQRIGAYEAAGVQELVLGFADPTSVDQLRQFAKLFVGVPSASSRTHAAQVSGAEQPRAGS